MSPPVPSGIPPVPPEAPPELVGAPPEVGAAPPLELEPPLPPLGAPPAIRGPPPLAMAPPELVPPAPCWSPPLPGVPPAPVVPPLPASVLALSPQALSARSGAQLTATKRNFPRVMTRPVARFSSGRISVSHRSVLTNRGQVELLFARRRCERSLGVARLFEESADGAAPWSGGAGAIGWSSGQLLIERWVVGLSSVEQ